MSAELTLRGARLDKGLTIRQAAKSIGVTEDILLGAEKGRIPRPKAAKKIADFYGYKVTDIWPIKDDPPPVLVGQVRKVEG